MAHLDLKAQLKASTRLAIQVNPRGGYVTHKLRVEAKLRLDDADSPPQFEADDWKALLDHFDSDQSVALGRGVFYLEGDTIEVDRFEAAALLTFLPDYFTPLDELTHTMLKAIQHGQYPLPSEDAP